MTPEERAARAERWAVARRHHPDLGGDAGVFAEEMRRLADRAQRPRPQAAPAAPVTVRRTTRGRTARWLRATPSLVARVRGRLPRSFPGSRRYGSL